MSNYDYKGDRIAAWLIGGFVVILLTAQFWTSWLDRAFPLNYSTTTPEQRVWQMECSGDIPQHQWIARGCGGP